jgi:hypothetical protein
MEPTGDNRRGNDGSLQIKTSEAALRELIAPADYEIFDRGLVEFTKRLSRPLSPSEYEHLVQIAKLLKEFAETPHLDTAGQTEDAATVLRTFQKSADARVVSVHKRKIFCLLLPALAEFINQGSSLHGIDAAWRAAMAFAYSGGDQLHRALLASLRLPELCNPAVLDKIALFTAQHREFVPAVEALGTALSMNVVDKKNERDIEDFLAVAVKLVTDKQDQSSQSFIVDLLGVDTQILLLGMVDLLERRVVTISQMGIVADEFAKLSRFDSGRATRTFAFEQLRYNLLYDAEFEDRPLADEHLKIKAQELCLRALPDSSASSDILAKVISGRMRETEQGSPVTPQASAYEYAQLLWVNNHFVAEDNCYVFFKAPLITDLSLIQGGPPGVISPLCLQFARLYEEHLYRFRDKKFEGHVSIDPYIEELSFYPWQFRADIEALCGKLREAIPLVSSIENVQRRGLYFENEIIAPLFKALKGQSVWYSTPTSHA